MLNSKLLAGCVLAASMHTLLNVPLQGRSVACTEHAPLQDWLSLSTDAIVPPMHIFAWQTWLHAFLQHAWACVDSPDHDS